MGVEILDGNSRDRESRDLKRYGRKGTRLVEPRDQRRALGRLGTGEFFSALEIGIARRIIESQNKKQIDTSQYKSETNRCV